MNIKSLWIVDSTNHMAMGQIKDARYVAMQMIPAMLIVDPNKILFDMVSFDDASSV